MSFKYGEIACFDMSIFNMSIICLDRCEVVKPDHTEH